MEVILIRFTKAVKNPGLQFYNNKIINRVNLRNAKNISATKTILSKEVEILILILSK